MDHRQENQTTAINCPFQSQDTSVTVRLMLPSISDEKTEAIQSLQFPGTYTTQDEDVGLLLEQFGAAQCAETRKQPHRSHCSRTRLRLIKDPNPALPSGQLSRNDWLSLRSKGASRLKRTDLPRTTCPLQLLQKQGGLAKGPQVQ